MNILQIFVDYFSYNIDSLSPKRNYSYIVMNMFGHMAKYAYYIFKEGVVNPNKSKVVNCHGLQRGYIDHHYKYSDV